MYEGRDISAWQGVKDPAWFAQFDFVAIRVFNEHGVLDSTFVENWRNAEGQTQRMAYGWPIAGADNHTLGQQLVRTAPGAEWGYWADYELGGWAQLPTPDELDAYLGGIESADSDADAGFYSNLAELPRGTALDETPWWFANPSGNPAPRPVAITQYGEVDGIDADRADTPPFGPAPTNQGDDDMLIGIYTDGRAWLIQGGVVIHEYSGAPTPTGFGTTVPAEAVYPLQHGVLNVALTASDLASLAARSAAATT